MFRSHFGTHTHWCTTAHLVHNEPDSTLSVHLFLNMPLEFLPGCRLHVLRHAPVWLVVWMWLASQDSGYTNAPQIQMVSIFDGKPHAMTSAFLDRGIAALPIEIEHGHVWQNVLRQEGQFTFLQYMFRSAEGSLHWWAPPCDQWLRFIAAVNHGRSADNLKGYSDRQKVADANRIAEMVAAGIIFCWSLGIWLCWWRKMYFRRLTECIRIYNAF